MADPPAGWKFDSIPVESILLDGANPRHDAVQSQRDAMHAIIAEQKAKLLTLARNIAANGLNPLDRLLVIGNPGGRTFTVLEGNRRMAALKLLRRPALAKDTDLEASIVKVAATAAPPDEVDAVIAPSRDEARRWLELRHRGEQDGAGVVPWNAVAGGRFETRPGTQVDRALSFIDTMQSIYPENATIAGLVDEIASTRVTTLGRLVADPALRSHLGIDYDAGRIVSHYPAEALESSVERVLQDVATTITVTQIKTKQQRAKYIKTLPKPDKAQFRPDAAPLDPTRPRTTPSPATPRPPRPGSPFKDLDLRKLGTRLTEIVAELRKLDVTKFPNATAILTRVVLELSVDEHIVQKQLSSAGELKTRIKRCLHEVDPTDKDPLYQGVRQGLADGSSMLAVATLHGYVHNPNFHPTPADVRGFVGNIKPFLQAMNDAV